VLVSACLVGVECTYRGADETRDAVVDALAGCGVVAVCPEVEGGLGVPRPRAEVAGGDGAAVLDSVDGATVRTADGADVTAEYLAGARAALAAAEAAGARLAVLKARSPSCGCSGIYDGTHTKVLRPDGVGVTAALLARSGIRVVDENCDPAEILRLAHGRS